MQKVTCVGERGNARKERRVGRKIDSEGTMELLNEIPCVTQKAEAEKLAAFRSACVLWETLVQTNKSKNKYKRTDQLKIGESMAL